MRRRKGLFKWLCFTYLLLPITSLAAGDDKIVLFRGKDGAPINWINLENTVEVDSGSFIVKGKSDHLDWQLLYNKRDLIQVDQSTGEIEFKIPIIDDEGDAEITTISPAGEVEKELVHIEIQHPRKEGELTKREQKTQEAQSIARIEGQNLRAESIKNRIKLGLAFTNLTYKQTRAEDTKISVPTISGGIGFPMFSKTADISLSGYLTTIPVSMSPKGSNMYFAGFNARMGYHHLFGDGWRLILSAGAYFVTTLGRLDLGYVNVMGPQLYPAISKTFNNASRIAAYFKFSPVSSSLTSFKIKNNEIATGIEYTFTPAEGGFFSNHTVGIGANFSKLYLEYSDDISQTVTSSLGINIGF